VPKTSRQEELFYKDNGSPQSAANVNFNLNLLDNLVAAGKPVIAVEYVTGSAKVTSVESKAPAAGIGYYIANPNLELNGVDTEGFTGGSLPPPSPAPVIIDVLDVPAWACLGRTAW
jgi:cysteinyl-tRNA synthetase, unknown class